MLHSLHESPPELVDPAAGGIKDQVQDEKKD